MMTLRVINYFEDIEVKPENGKLVIFSNSQHLHYVRLKKREICSFLLVVISDRGARIYE